MSKNNCNSINIYNNRIRRTVIESESSEVKQISVNESVYNLVSDMAEYNNRKYTQGIIVYEYILMQCDDITDYFDQNVEKYVNNELRELGVDVSKINEIEWSDKHKFNDNGSKRVRYWLPQRVAQQYTGSWADVITNSVKNGFNSIYYDRTDRVEVKRDLIEYIKSGKKPDNKRAVKIVDDSDDIDIPAELRFTEDTIIDDVDSYKNMADEVADSWGERYELIDDVLSSVNLTRRQIHTMIVKAHDIDTDDYIDSKIDEYAVNYNKPYLLDTDTIDIDASDDELINNMEYYLDVKNYSIEQIIYNISSVDKCKISRKLDESDKYKVDDLKWMIKDDDNPVTKSPAYPSKIIYKSD